MPWLGDRLLEVQRLAAARLAAEVFEVALRECPEWLAYIAGGAGSSPEVRQAKLAEQLLVEALSPREAPAAG